MNESTPSPKRTTPRRLAEHLAKLDQRSGQIPPKEQEMLSLMVSRALSGENLAEHYPDFYQKLLQNAELREAFLDALIAIEEDRAGTFSPIPNPVLDLNFLQQIPVQPQINLASKNTWNVIWQKTLEELNAILSPPDLVYRAEQDLLEEPWFTLLRDEIPVAGITYSITLECSLANELENQLAVYVVLAVTPDTPPAKPNFPLHAELQWGPYQQRVEIPSEGRVRFPDIPLEIIFDPSSNQPRAGLSLTLATTD